jgi:hypothetical protein
MEYAERVRLQNNYRAASATFDEARARFQLKLGTSPKSEFLALTDELDRASTALERTRAALASHMWEHCCMVLSSTVPED